jgi:TPR repeat protein
VFVTDIAQEHLAIVDSLRPFVLDPLQRDKPSLENFTADASLERNEYHTLDLHELTKLDDAEALYQRGDRLRQGIKAFKNETSGWRLIIEAAGRGHAVALGLCFVHGRGVEQNEARAIELLRASADRGHASGARTRACLT